MIESIAKTAQEQYEKLVAEGIPPNLIWKVLVLRVIKAFHKAYESHRL